jgi:Protein of unknown function (DUF4239)
MSSVVISGIVFACLFGGALLGMIVRALLPEKHLCTETKDVIKLGMGLIGTMTALVLGLLIASAKSSFDAQRNGMAQLAGNVILLDRALAFYGPDAKDVREELRVSVADFIQRMWPEEDAPAGLAQPNSTDAARYARLVEKIQGLKPEKDAQRVWQNQAVKTATDIGAARWLMFAQQGRSIPTPFLVLMVAWLTLILANFALLAPRNVMATLTLMVCALAISSAIFLILELDQPFGGIIQVSSTPLRNALAQLGR